jgi:hypothetical protein
MEMIKKEKGKSTNDLQEKKIFVFSENRSRDSPSTTTKPVETNTHK